MPKESRRSGSRASNRRRSTEASDDGRKSILRESSKHVGNVARFAPFQREIARRESKYDEEETITTLIRSTTTNSTENTKSSSGIIENGMKYIMFPLHLLRFCIFGTTTTLSIAEEKSKRSEVIESSKKDMEKEKSTKVKDNVKKDTVVSLKDKDKEKEKKSENGRRSSDDSKRSSKDKTRSSDSKNRSEERSSRDRRESNERSKRREERNRSMESKKNDHSRRTDEDSDSSSSDKWSTAESSMDVSIEYESAYESATSYALEEPMDISIEESIDENSSRIPRNSSHRTGTSFRVNVKPSSSVSSSSEIEEISSSSSIEEEIARVFRKKCTSSCSSDNENDDDSSPISSPRDARRNELDRRDRDERENVVSRSSSHDSKTKSEKARIKSSPRRKEESHRDKIVERRATTTTTSTNGHNASPRRVSKTPIKSKDTKKRYKEKGIQTDSAFSDDDVEMIPLDARLTEKRTSGRFYRRKHQSVSSQMAGTDRDIFYIADNEDSNDGYGWYSRNRISPVSGSSSSTDLGFEDQRYPTTNYRSYVSQRERPKSSWRGNGTTNDRPKGASLPRAPPGFPQLPQNPPIPLQLWNDNDSFDFPFTTETNPCILQYGPNYPPAPTPMRHLYHEYPEFMPFPEEIDCSKMFKTMLANGYLS